MTFLEGSFIFFTFSMSVLSMVLDLLSLGPTDSLFMLCLYMINTK